MIGCADAIVPSLSKDDRTLIAEIDSANFRSITRELDPKRYFVMVSYTISW